MFSRPKIALALGSLLLGFAFAETVIHLFDLAPDYKFYPGPFVEHDVYDYGLTANYQGHQGDIPIHTDAVGMRIAQGGRADEAGYRVLLLGDSVPFGWGIRYEETFAHLLEEELRKTRPSAVVLNASVPGYSTWHEYQYLKTHIDQLKPNLVILCLHVYDYVEREWVANKRGTLTKRGMEDMRSDLAEILFNNPFLSRYSGMYRLLKNVVRDYLYSRHDAEHHAGILDLLVPSAHALDLETWPWLPCFRYLVQIQKLLEERDIALHVLDFTENTEVRTNLKGNYNVTHYVERDRNNNTLPKDSHPNARGHRLIFEQLLSDIISQQDTHVMRVPSKKF